MIDEIQNLMVSNNIKKMELDDEGRVSGIHYFTKPVETQDEKTVSNENPFEDNKDPIDPKDDPDMWPDGERPMFTRVRESKVNV